MSDEDFRPYTLVAEITYRCPLQCLYCSNPVSSAGHGADLDSTLWQRVFTDASALGVVQVTLSGGEPLVRSDLEVIVHDAQRAGLYTNLITGGVPLSRARLARLRECGLDALQLSLQDTVPQAAAAVAGGDFLAQKLAVAQWAKDLGLPLTINVVLHRGNIERVLDFIALAEQLGAGRLELANTQYLGWALVNRDALLPSRAAIDDARRIAEQARARLKGKMEILFVMPDYHTGRPRACMNGWGRRYMVIAPDGRVLPCHQAHSIPHLTFGNVRDQALAEIWKHSPAFALFRGEDWMPSPCRTCDRRTIDFGGCRCQAFHLTGDAHAVDPACALSPQHHLIQTVRAAADTPVSASTRPRRLVHLSRRTAGSRSQA